MDEPSRGTASFLVFFEGGEEPDDARVALRSRLSLWVSSGGVW